MISSVVATFGSDSAITLSVIDELKSNPSIEVGEIIGVKLPITIEAKDSKTLETITRQIQSMPGVQNVDVVFVSLSE